MLVTKLGKHLTKTQYGSIFTVYYSYETVIAVSQGDNLYITRETHSNSTVKHKERIKKLHPSFALKKQQTIDLLNRTLTNVAAQQGVD